MTEADDKNVGTPADDNARPAAATRTLSVLGEKIKQLRAERGLTREGLSLLSRGPDAVSVATLKRAERGQPIYPTTAAAIARLLGVSVDTITAKARELGAAHGSQMAIAVLPFVAIDGGEPAQIFADGLVEEVIHRLGGCWFPVIARCSAFSFRGQGCNARQIGQALEADYLVDGSVRVHSGRVRVSASLVDAQSGVQVWSHVYDEPYGRVFDVQDKLAAAIASQAGGRMLDQTIERLRSRALGEMAAYELALTGLWHFHRGTFEDNRRARELVQAALTRAPSLPLAWYVLVLSHQHDLLNQWTADPRATLREMRTCSERFEGKSPDHPLMHVAAAYTFVAHGERADAVARLEDALELDANSFAAHFLYGQALAMGAQADQGIHELNLACQLSPCDPRLWAVQMTTSLAHFAAQRYEDAVHWARLAQRKRPKFPLVCFALASAQAQLGDVSSAQRTVSELGPLVVGEAALRGMFGSTDQEIAERFAAGLRLAGLKAR